MYDTNRVTYKITKFVKLISMPMLMSVFMFTAMSFELPLADPVLKFLIILLIILFAPLVLERFRIPPLLGLIIAGAVIGPNGFNLVLRDGSIILSGTAGLLYIMFLAGLEIDMADFRRNSWKSLVFGFYTFAIPMGLGTLMGLYILQYNMMQSVLLASMLASHTLIAYVIISKLGLSKDPAVSITVGGTMITDTLALLVLTVIVGMHNGEAGQALWIRIGISLLLFALIILLIFPPLCRWFFKKYHDNISQYIFVLVLLFFGAFFAQLAGMEAILGAFLSGLALNRLIPRTSPLMNRIEFVGNAIFIPFFLISVGMLIDYRAFFTSFETIKVGIAMIVVATFSKYAAAWLTQKTCRFSDDQRRVIFGLSNAQAAATLAAVMVGYNVGILDEAVLNGTILMILVTCTMASFSAQKGAHNMASAMAGTAGEDMSGKPKDTSLQISHQLKQRILVALGAMEHVEELVKFGLSLRSGKKGEQSDMVVARVIEDHFEDESVTKMGRMSLELAANTASSVDVRTTELLRYDINFHNALRSIVNEMGITDLIYGQSTRRDLSSSDLKNMADAILVNSNINTYIYRSVQPMSTVKRHVLLLPELAEMELGFEEFIVKMKSLSGDSGIKVVVNAETKTLDAVKAMTGKKYGNFVYVTLDDWKDLHQYEGLVRGDDMLWVMMSRRGGLSYSPFMSGITSFLQKTASGNNYVLCFPRQVCLEEGTRFYT